MKKSEKTLSMPKDEGEGIRCTNPVKPGIGGIKIPPDQTRELFFLTTTSHSFPEKKNTYQSTSLSDYHQAAHRVRSQNERKAPFWSREMTRYASSPIPAYPIGIMKRS